MPRKRDEGFVLWTRPLGEADLIVTLLTAEEGKLHAVARSAKRSRKRFGAALEPLTRVRASWTETEGRELAKLESCDIVTSYVRAQEELGCFYLFAYIAEVAGVFAREKEADPRFFRLVGAVLDAAAAGLPVGAARRYFDLWTLRLQGLLPELSSCSGCGAACSSGEAVVSLTEGTLLCPSCGGRVGGQKVRLSQEALEAARLAMRRPPAEAASLASPDGCADTRRLEALDRLSRELMLRFTERPLRTLRFLDGIGG